MNGPEDEILIDETFTNKKKIKWSKWILWIVMTILLLLLIIGVIYYIYTISSKNNWETAYLGKPTSSAAQLLSEQLTAHAHIAGSDQDYITATYVKDKFTSYGIPHVEIQEHKVLLTYPIETFVEVIQPDNLKYVASLTEDVIPEDPTSGDKYAVGAFNGYGANGDVTGSLVYANYGRVEDYAYLDKMGVNLTGVIVICRYGRIFRGNKVMQAEQRGAIGVILYSDPIDDGNNLGPVYPTGPWRPPSSFQRGSVWTGDGDPLTPDYPSLDISPRITLNEAFTSTDFPSLPKIPVIPMGYADAFYFLRIITNVTSPSGWKGGLNVTYNIGPSSGLVHIRANISYNQTKIWNVIGKIPGLEEPDRHVIFGSHRDAWTMGAGDPISGTVTLLQMAQGMGSIYAAGWRPRRNIIFCSWDGEEYGLIGSTEFVEKYVTEIQAKTVAYINVDGSVRGQDVFNAAGVPSLFNVLQDASMSVNLPNSQKKIYDIWSSVNGTPSFPPLAAGSDYKPFLQKAGVACIDMRFESHEHISRAVYHSNYDSFTWMKKFGDPGFAYHPVMAQLLGILAIRLADERILPLSYNYYADSLNNTISSMEKVVQSLNITSGYDLSFKNLKDSVVQLKAAAENIEKFKLSVRIQDDIQVRTLNDRLMLTERVFIDPKGILNQTDVRHVLFAPNPYNSYGGDAFPALWDAIFRKDPKGINFQIGYLSVYVSRAAQFLNNSLL